MLCTGEDSHPLSSYVKKMKTAYIVLSVSLLRLLTEKVSEIVHRNDFYPVIKKKKT